MEKMGCFFNLQYKASSVSFSTNDTYEVLFEFFPDGSYIIKSSFIGVETRLWRLNHELKIVEYKCDNMLIYQRFWPQSSHDNYNLYLLIKEWMEIDSILLEIDSESN